VTPTSLSEGERPGDYLVERQRFSLLERVRGVAVAATKMTRREPDEHAGEAGERTLALQAAVDLVDHQGADRLPFERPEPVRMRLGRQRPGLGGGP